MTNPTAAALRSTPILAESDAEMPKKPARPVVEIPEQSYQPSVKELNEDIGLSGTFEDAVKALVRPVKVRRVPRGKPPKKGS